MANKKYAITSLGDATKVNITYVDNTKKIIQCVNSTPKFDSSQKYNCYWCTLPIENAPLGCPTKLICHYKTKIHQVKDGETLTRMEPHQRQDEQHLPSNYVTYGIFCSFNCVKAHINANVHDFKYQNSIRLLTRMYSEVTGDTGPVTIRPSPDKSLMMMYGGPMTPQQYVQSFNKITYIDRGTTNMFPMSLLYEEQEIM